MKFKKNIFLITMAIVLCVAVAPFPASANVPAAETQTKTQTDEALSVNDNVESKTPLTPSGNLTTVDDVHQVTDKETIEDKQFITVQSKNGNTFYIIIDRSGDTENVYFLNAVDEADLLALTEDGQKSATVKTCTCTTKCVLGDINADCEVCAQNKDECLGTPSAAVQQTEKEETPEKSQNNTTPLIAFVIIVLIGAGAALYWFKLRNKKPSTKGATDPNDVFEEDEDADEEDTEVETDDETDYETEDGDEGEEMPEEQSTDETEESEDEEQ